MVADNWKEVQARIRAVASRVGRDPREVACMAVSKAFPPERIREAYDAGLRLFGENRVQEFAHKWPALRDLPDAEWHMIGHLQSNKAARAAELFAGIDSLDSVRLAEKLNLSARLLGRKLPVLVEINMGEEAAKSGVAPESRALNELLEKAAELDHLEFRGLMAIPPFTEDPEQARPFFRHLRELRDQIAARKLASVGMHVLSMGMSHDFEVAIEEGSTCVRIGTAIFGERTATNI
ncbi:MAG TPA: YggS family pyridoxal phosphate-dependent enzyme [Terriglobales bacterium]|nr:YggS family pyridoxal phosphate-dependent enzyme [Terriglobales bacterium]